MRERDLKALEFDKVRALVAALSASESARAVLSEMQPSIDADEVRRNLRSCAELVELRAHAGSLPIAEFADMRSLLMAAARQGAALGGAALVSIRDFVIAASDLQGFLRSRVDPFPNVAALVRDLLAPKELADALLKALADDGMLLDDASHELKRLRNRLRDERLELETRLARQLNAAGIEPIVSDHLVTIRNRRFVLPLKLNYAERLAGIVQDRSVSGETLFVEPMWAVELNNRLMLLEREAEAEERRILEQLTAMVRGYVRELRLTFAAMVALDALNARARFAQGFRCVEPEIVPDGIELPGARHPLLMASGREVIPIDAAIAAGRRGIVISGPNTGGKTVALKTIGLLSMMAQAGLLIPAAAGAKLAVFQGIFADIGDQQSIEADLSSFSAHIVNLREIFLELREPALVILDEPGGGTDPAEGAALTIALLDYFAARNCLVAIATHSTAVKLHAYSRAGLESSAVDFDAEQLRPLFRLKPHTIGQSYGLAVARRLGLPEEIVRAAEDARPAGSGELETALARLEAERAELARRVGELAEREAAMERREREALARAERIRDQAQAERDRLRGEGGQLLASIRREGDEMLREIRAQSKSRHDLAALGAGASRRLDELAPPSAAIEADTDQTPLKVGDQVVLGDIRGELLVLEGDKAVIARGGLRIEVSPARLRRASPARPISTAPKVSVIAERSEAAELNLVGMRTTDALRKLEEFLDQAYLTSKSEVRVVHGIGSGILSKAIREYLGSSPYCASFREAEPHHGGAGATIIQIAA